MIAKRKIEYFIYRSAGDNCLRLDTKFVTKMALAS